MASTTRIYRRFPGTGLSLASYLRLYQGPDHLLQVQSTGFTEKYKRFYFRDIQAFVLRRTNWGKVFNGLWGGLALIFGLSAVATAGTGFDILFGIVSGFFVLNLFINVTMGPTCVCHVRTAVQTEKLGSMGRLRRARILLDRLRPVILEAQSHGAASPGPMVPDRHTGAEGASAAVSPHGMETSKPLPPMIQPPRS
jgi:hypothetical protein